MIAGAALSAWLADRQAQKASHDAVEDSARRWSRHPLMGEMERELAGLADRGPPALLDAARRFIHRTDDIEALIGDFIASSRADAFFRPPYHPISSEIHTGLLLFDHPDLAIALGVTGVDMLAAKKLASRGAVSLGFSGLVNLYRYVKAGDAVLSFWEAPPITGDFIGARAGQARFVERRRIEDGEEIVVDGRYQSFIVEHCESDMLYFQAMVRAGASPIAVEYDSETLNFIGASSTDEASSRVQMMVSLLRAMERDDAVPLIEGLLDSAHFYTRWHIMRELLAMDVEAALPVLRNMATSDPHFEVRAAARQTLELFFPEEAPAANEGEVACRA